MPCVIVLGLPRSGTSALAGCLAQVGVHMGDRLMPALPGVNDKGFFEDEEFVAMHIKMMRAHEDPQILFDIPEPPDPATLAEYAQLIRRREAQHRWWGVKDPKLCFLLPYLLRRLNERPKILVTRRPFHESVQSMKLLYGGMTLDRASHLLSRYLYSLEKNLSPYMHDDTQLRLMEVSYHALLSASSPYTWTNPTDISRGELDRILRYLDLIDAVPDAVKRAQSFIEPSLRRQY